MEIAAIRGIVLGLLGVAGLLLQGCATTTASSTKRKGLLYSGQERLGWPVKGQVSSYYGKRNPRWHYGLDIRAQRGSKIVAAADGRVIKSGWQRGYGLTVVVRHRSFQTLYAHCLDVEVEPGDVVRRGEIIGSVGKTGNARGYHLHFEVRTLKWTALNPLDYLPLKYL